MNEVCDTCHGQASWPQLQIAMQEQLHNGRATERTFMKYGGVANILTCASLAATRSRSLGYSAYRSTSVCAADN